MILQENPDTVRRTISARTTREGGGPERGTAPSRTPGRVDQHADRVDATDQFEADAKVNSDRFTPLVSERPGMAPKD